MRFEGFPKEMPAFFTMLSFNNTRAFFEENRALYESAVRAPLLALAEALVPVALSIDPLFDARPSRIISRIRRDTRFSRNKSPYREYMWLGFRRLGESREETCGFYFDFSATEAHWGCGYYHAQRGYMDALRASLVRDSEGALAIVTEPRFAGQFNLCGEAYVRQFGPPESLPEPLRPLYAKKSLYAEHTLDDLSLLFKPALADAVAEGFEALAPFYRLLRACMTS